MYGVDFVWILKSPRDNFILSFYTRGGALCEKFKRLRFKTCKMRLVAMSELLAAKIPKQWYGILIYQLHNHIVCNHV